MKAARSGSFFFEQQVKKWYKCMSFQNGINSQINKI